MRLALRGTVVAGGLLPLYFCMSAAALSPTQCISSTEVEPKPSTELLPAGTCPIRIGGQCFDRRYGLEVSNSCKMPVRILIQDGYQAGEYTLEIGKPAQHFSCLEAVQNCHGVRLKVLGFIPPPCAGSNLSAARAAMSQTKQALDSAVTSLANPNSAQLALAEKWFGIRSSSDAVGVRDALMRMSAFSDSASFLCSGEEATKDEEDTFAYVQEDKPFTVVLDHNFFAAPETGFGSSRPGILVHEMSHFLLTAGTEDPKVYGEQPALDLAKKDPKAAQRNAENFEYFVEELTSQRAASQPAN
jgi:hypothetical protein